MVYYSKKRGKIFYKGHHAPISFPDTKYGHHASQNQGIGQHTQHAAGPVEKCTAKIGGADIDGTNAPVLLGDGRRLATDRRWSSPSGIAVASTTVRQVFTRRSRATDCPKLSRKALLGHRTVESSAIGPHQQTYALTHQVSRGGAVAHIVPSVQQGAIRRRHT